MNFIYNKKYAILFFTLLLTTMVKPQDKNHDFIEVKNLSINTNYSDFGALQYNDSLLLFSSSKKGSKSQRIWKDNMQPFLKIYTINNKIKNVYTNEKLFDTNNKIQHHISSVSFNANNTMMYFTTNNLSKLDSEKTKQLIMLKLYSAKLIANKWSDIKELPFNSSKYSTGHPWLSKDQKKLYFISDMPGGYGLTDIYEVNILPDGSFSSVKNLGSEVNTKGKEMFPFVDENNILYYSSNGFKEGIGGLDIYYTDLNKDTLTVKNIGRPINSESDDFAFYKFNGVNKGYFSSNRVGGKGDDDIYSYEDKRDNQIKKCQDSIQIIFKDSNTLQPLNGVEAFLKPYHKKLLKAKITNNGGTFRFIKSCTSISFEISAFKKGYSQFKKVFKIENGEKKYMFFLEKDILSEKIVKIIDNKLQIIVGNIYFGYDNFKVNKESKSKLDMLVDIMLRYPKIKIKVNSHTDSRGTDLYNLQLSKKRALSIKNYIVKQGVSINRVFHEGYGEREITNRCLNTVKCTIEEHLMNRRTNFLIIK